VPKVQEEIVGRAVFDLRFKTAVESGKLKVRAPTEKYIAEVKEAASAVGDFGVLSETDIQLLALAFEILQEGYEPLIISDDYAIQNVAGHLGVAHASLATFGIRKLLHWIRYCPACHRRYRTDSQLAKCEICGTELRRKPVRHSRETKILNKCEATAKSGKERETGVSA
jgi:UPF0271 protein